MNRDKYHMNREGIPMFRGISVSILKRNGLDCSLGGFSSKNNDGILLTPNGMGFQYTEENLSKVIVVDSHRSIDIYPVAYPAVFDSETGFSYKRGQMGGCHIYSSDSRFSEIFRHITGFSFSFPISLHDRYE